MLGAAAAGIHGSILQGVLRDELELWQGRAEVVPFAGIGWQHHVNDSKYLCWLAD